MTPEEESERRDAIAPDWYESILDLLDELDVTARVSYGIVEEAAIHYWRDIERLFVIHHEYVHPTKACSYLAFWIRKVKPVSDAYPKSVTKSLSEGSDDPYWQEITNINEQVGIHLALRMLRNCIVDEGIDPPNKVTKQAFLKVFDRVSREYLVGKLENGLSMGSRFENLIYDMRFRTFGPHHLTHVLAHIMREVVQKCQESRK